MAYHPHLFLLALLASALIQYLDAVGAKDSDILLVTRWLLQLQTSHLCSKQEVEERGKELHLSCFIRKTETFPEPALRLMLISPLPRTLFPGHPLLKGTLGK